MVGGTVDGGTIVPGVGIVVDEAPAVLVVLDPVEVVERTAVVPVDNVLGVPQPDNTVTMSRQVRAEASPAKRRRANRDLFPIAGDTLTYVGLRAPFTPNAVSVGGSPLCESPTTATLSHRREQTVRRG